MEMIRAVFEDEIEGRPQIKQRRAGWKRGEEEYESGVSCPGGQQRSTSETNEERRRVAIPVARVKEAASPTTPGRDVKRDFR